MSKKYTLELTAEELEGSAQFGGYNAHQFDKKLDALRKQARQDRAAAELRLPWRVGQCDNHYFVLGPISPEGNRSERAAKLMSAAPELLEAVNAVKAYHECDTKFDWNQCMKWIDRALRKVSTGIPEEK